MKLDFCDDVYALGIILLEIFPEFGSIDKAQVIDSKGQASSSFFFLPKTSSGNSPAELGNAAKNLKDFLRQMIVSDRNQRLDLRQYQEIVNFDRSPVKSNEEKLGQNHHM